MRKREITTIKIAVGICINILHTFNLKIMRTSYHAQFKIYSASKNIYRFKHLSALIYHVVNKVLIPCKISYFALRMIY